MQPPPARDRARAWAGHVACALARRMRPDAETSPTTYPTGTQQSMSVVNDSTCIITFSHFSSRARNALCDVRTAAPPHHHATTPPRRRAAAPPHPPACPPVRLPACPTHRPRPTAHHTARRCLFPTTHPCYQAGIDGLGITNIGTIYKNQTYEELAEHEERNNEGVFSTHDGCFAVDTGVFTGRSPR